MTFGGVEALLIPWYAQTIADTRVVSETPSDLQVQVPLLQVVSLGGAADRSVPGRARIVRWALHAFEVGDPATAALAEAAMTATLISLRNARLPGADVSATDVIAAPAFVPYADTLIRQYVASYSAYLLLT